MTKLEAADRMQSDLVGSRRSTFRPPVASSWPGDQIALLGHSVGAAAALPHTAHQHDVSAVVSLSAFAHRAKVMRRFMAEKRIPHAPLGWYVLPHLAGARHP